MVESTAVDRVREGAERVRRALPGPATVLAALAIVLAVAACDTRPAWEQARGRLYFDSTGTYVHAGVSTRTDVDIEPLDRASLRGDTTGRPFHLYSMRCGSCHDAPDPAMKTGEHWSYLIGRMQDKTATAGLIPMTDAEADTVLGFLRRHAPR